jgi:hypothetical protein
MSTRARLIWAGLLAAATTASVVGAPAMIQASLSFRTLE